MDRERGKIHSKANKDIAIAVRTGGSLDPETNMTLAAVLQRLKAQGVPKELVENALKRAAGGGERGDQQLVYEAIAPGSVGLIIECQTDNVTRAMHKVRNVLTTNSARLAPVKFMFTRQGLVKVALEHDGSYAELLEPLIEKMIDAGAEDFVESVPEEGDAEVTFTCQPEDLNKLTSVATKTGMCKELLSSDLVYSPVEKTADLDEDTVRNTGRKLRYFHVKDCKQEAKQFLCISSENDLQND
ncbi:transcriptional regulator TACO1-like protein [Fomitopsis serialis]|uniref:transcriptional regulator TACO1-like protein n=1 Tax=Fomitopsis serialis TaxID=139415 RepID=UPI0020086022|nr:transcriptional regulator TACO1-like protein [Neoantrodia serialis]KAH9934919.1 transcriptional regulator TACO1-like protein [Neoantrodia serialis]